MNTIIMLCGMGNSGKSTVAKAITNSYKPIINLSVDAISKFYSLIDKQQPSIDILLDDYKYYIKKFSSTGKNLILDFSQDTIESRKKILNYIENKQDTNIIVVSVRPNSFEDYKQNIFKRQNHLPNKDELDHLKLIYDSYIFPTLDEFNQFNSSHIITVNDASDNNIKKIIDIVMKIS